MLLLKRWGIMMSNMKKIQSNDTDKNDLLRERKSSQSKEEKLVYCSKCFGFFAKKFFHKHRNNCHEN
jgi:hypothetical protein